MSIFIPFIPIAIVAIVMWAVVQIVRHSLRYSESIERMKHGYPLKDGTWPAKKKFDLHNEEPSEHADELDIAVNRQQ